MRVLSWRIQISGTISKVLILVHRRFSLASIPSSLFLSPWILPVDASSFSVLTSNYFTSRSMLATMPNTVLIDVIFTTSANISSKSTPFFCWKPFTMIQALYLGGFPPSPDTSLYTHLFWSALFPFGKSVNSYVWFSCKEFISSCMAYNHYRLWVSLLASSKLFGSPSSVNNLPSFATIVSYSTSSIDSSS